MAAAALATRLGQMAGSAYRVRNRGARIAVSRATIVSAVGMVLVVTVGPLPTAWPVGCGEHSAGFLLIQDAPELSLLYPTYPVLSSPFAPRLSLMCYSDFGGKQPWQRATRHRQGS